MKFRNPLYTFPTKTVLNNLDDAKKELNWNACKADQKLIYSEIPVKLFYNKHTGTTLCTRCGTKYPSQQEFRHNAKSVCPKCKQKGILQNCNLFKPGITYFKKVFARYMTRGKNKAVCRCVAYYGQYVDISNDKEPSLHYTHEPLTITVIRANEVRVRMCKYNSELHLSNRDSFSSYSGYFWPQWYAGDITLSVRKQTVQGTSFQKYFDCMPVSDRTPQNMLLMCPQIEKLYKVGLNKMALSLLDKITESREWHKRWINVEAIPEDGPVCKMLGITRPALAFMSKVDAPDARFLHFADKYGLPYDDVWRMVDTENLWNCMHHLEHLEVVVKQYELSMRKVFNIFKDDKDDSVIGIYTDYIKNLKEVGEYPDDKRFLYPPRDRLDALHDEMALKKEHEIMRRKVEENKEIDRRIREYAESLSKFILADDNYIIRPLNGIMELETESRLMSHCVKTYDERMANHECAIFSLRAVNAPDLPIGTIEVRWNKQKSCYFIEQKRGKHNAALTNEISAWINNWLENYMNAQAPRGRKKKSASSCVA